ncbi:hypothetical protein NFI96_005188, partial [Prochilodus magdalenae]
MATVLQGQKQLLEKFWKGACRAVTTPRPESVIIASIVARRAHSSAIGRWALEGRDLLGDSQVDWICSSEVSVTARSIRVMDWYLVWIGIWLAPKSCVVPLEAPEPEPEPAPQVKTTERKRHTKRSRMRKHHSRHRSRSVSFDADFSPRPAPKGKKKKKKERKRRRERSPSFSPSACERRRSKKTDSCSKERKQSAGLLSKK